MSTAGRTPEAEREYDELLWKAKLPSFAELSLIADEAQVVIDAPRPLNMSPGEQVAHLQEVMARLPVDVREDEHVFDCVNGIILSRKFFADAQRRAQRFVSELVQPPFNKVVDLSTVFCAPLPGRLGKANVRQFGNEYLLLFDGGLTRLIASVAETVAQLCVVVEDTHEIKFGFSPVAETLGWIDESRSRLYRIFQQYESAGKIHTKWLPLPPLNSALAARVSNCAMQFVFHHELSHVVLGHCGDHLPILPGYEPPASMSAQALREAQADTYALMIGMLLLPGEDNSVLQAAHILAGAELIFHAAGLLERFGERKVFDPSAATRLTMMRSNRGNPWAPSNCTLIADLFQLAFDKMLPDGIYSDSTQGANGPLLMPVSQVAVSRVRGKKVVHLFALGKSRPLHQFARTQFECADETTLHMLCMHLAATISLRLASSSNASEVIESIVAELREFGHDLGCAEKPPLSEKWCARDGGGLSMTIRSDGEPIEITWC